MHAWAFKHTLCYCLTEHERAVAIDKKLSCFLLIPTLFSLNITVIKRRKDTGLSKEERRRNSVLLDVLGRLPMPSFLISQLKWQINLLHSLSLSPHTDHTTSQALNSLDGEWAELCSQLPPEESPVTPSWAPFRRVGEPGCTPAATDLDRQLLSGMQKCFSHKPVSWVFIPTVVVVEWKVMYSKLSCELFDFDAFWW